MTTHIDIPEDILQRAMKAAGTKSPQEAVIKAVEEYARQHDQAELIQYLGGSDSFMSAEQLEHLREAE